MLILTNGMGWTWIWLVVWHRLSCRLSTGATDIACDWCSWKERTAPHMVSGFGVVSSDSATACVSARTMVSSWSRFENQCPYRAHSVSKLELRFFDNGISLAHPASIYLNWLLANTHRDYQLNLSQSHEYSSQAYADRSIKSAIGKGQTEASRAESILFLIKKSGWFVFKIVCLVFAVSGCKVEDLAERMSKWV